MNNNFKMKFIGDGPAATTSDTQKVLDWFYDFAAEGGLTDEINPRMRQDINMEIYLTGSGLDFMEFTFVRTPPPFKKQLPK